MLNLKIALAAILAMLLGLVLWMAWFYYFRTDGRGHVLRAAESPAAAARGQQLLRRADALIGRRQYEPAQILLDSLRDADVNPAVFISTEALLARMDTLRARRRH